MSHSQYKVLHSKSQGQMHYILCRTLKYVYVRQIIVILQAWAFFTNYIRVRIPVKYLKVVTKGGTEKKTPHNVSSQYSFSYFRFMNT
jgi:hypothetical protein